MSVADESEDGTSLEAAAAAGFRLGSASHNTPAAAVSAAADYDDDDDDGHQQAQSRSTGRSNSSSRSRAIEGETRRSKCKKAADVQHRAILLFQLPVAGKWRARARCRRSCFVVHSPDELEAIWFHFTMHQRGTSA